MTHNVEKYRWAEEELCKEFDCIVDGLNENIHMKELEKLAMISSVLQELRHKIHHGEKLHEQHGKAGYMDLASK